mgnify:CR=1 FL=1
MAADLAEYIYNSRQLLPNESQLIKNFYYSIYHLVKAISVLDTGIEYKSHSSLISYFNREIKHDDFLKKFNMIFEDPAPHLMPDFLHASPVSTHFVRVLIFP